MEEGSLPNGSREFGWKVEIHDEGPPSRRLGHGGATGGGRSAGIVSLNSREWKGLFSESIDSQDIPSHSWGICFTKSQVNRVFLRQTGSLMKPIVYALAYRMGLPASASGAPFFEGSYNPTGKKQWTKRLGRD